MRKTLSAALMICCSGWACADGCLRESVDRLAPAGVFFANSTQKGEWLVEYRFAGSFYEDNRVGEQEVSDFDAIGAPGAPAGVTVDSILTNEEAAPIAMSRSIHIASLAYGLTEEVSVYTLLPFADVSIDHLRGDSNPAGRGSTFELENAGLADIEIGGLFRLFANEKHRVFANLGGSLPTGDIYDESTIQSGGAALQPLSFPLRLGSGTFNLRTGITWRRFGKRFSSGAQAQANLPLGRNYRGYSVSDEYLLNTWSSFLVKPNWALSLRTEYRWRTDYDGIDFDLPDNSVSTNVEAFRGGYWLSGTLGTQFMIGQNRFSAEIGPTYKQDVDGLQLERDYEVFLNWARFF